MALGLLSGTHPTFRGHRPDQGSQELDAVLTGSSWRSPNPAQITHIPEQGGGETFESQHPDGICVFQSCHNDFCLNNRICYLVVLEARSLVSEHGSGLVPPAGRRESPCRAPSPDVC